MKKNNLTPFIIVIILIAIGIGIYFIKIKNNQKKSLNTSNKQEKQTNDKEEKINYVSSSQVFNAINKDDFSIVDIRSKDFFNFEHIESSINYPLKKDDPIKSLPKDVFSRNKKIIIIDNFDSSKGKTLVQFLSDSGYNSYLLEGGIEDYYSQRFPLISEGNIDSALDKTKVNSISAQEIFERIEKQNEIFRYLDVRKEKDFEDNHLEGSINIPLEEIEKQKNNIPIGKILIVDENPLRSFQAAVRLHDMGIWGVYYLSDSLSNLEKVVKEKELNTETQE